MSDFASQTSRTRQLLLEAGISSIDDLCALSEVEVLEKIGVRARNQLEDLLAQRGRMLRVDAPIPLVVPFYEALRNRYAESGDFGLIGQEYGMSRQAAYELFFWSQRAAKTWQEQQDKHVKWREQSSVNQR